VTGELYLGMRPGDLAGRSYAHFWNPRLAPLAAAAREALLVGPLPAPLLPRRDDAAAMLAPGDAEVEDGYGRADDGTLVVAVRTAMPDVTPAMIDWWFGWHSAERERYKLWHPRAHLRARWPEPESTALAAAIGRPRYVGRTSLVDEYLGDAVAHVAIHFLPPAELGFAAAGLADDREATVVAARVSLAGVPVDGGYLLHHVRRVAGGSEMRSRFWLGGPHARVRAGWLERPVSGVARRLVRPPLGRGRDLLVHCAQEMAHLASFLPRLHRELHDHP
jgi:hypothetical protein